MRKLMIKSHQDRDVTHDVVLYKIREGDGREGDGRAGRVKAKKY